MDKRFIKVRDASHSKIHADYAIQLQNERFFIVRSIFTLNNDVFFGGTLCEVDEVEFRVFNTNATRYAVVDHKEFLEKAAIHLKNIYADSYQFVPMNYDCFIQKSA